MIYQNYKYAEYVYVLYACKRYYGAPYADQENVVCIYLYKATAIKAMQDTVSRKIERDSYHLYFSDKHHFRLGKHVKRDDGTSYQVVREYRVSKMPFSGKYEKGL